MPENEDDEVSISDDDMEFFADNHGFTSFLTGLDSKELSRYRIATKCIIDKQHWLTWLYRNVVKKKKTQPRKPAPKQEEKGDEGLNSSDESEEFNSDDELDQFEEPSDEEDLDDDDMDQLLAEAEEENPSEEKKQKPVKKEANDSDEEMDYETRPRKVASEWTRKDYHTKLPIKLPGGRIHQLDESQNAESSEEEEQEEAVKEEAVAEEQEEEEEEKEEELKLTKKQYLLKKKEELALIAGNLQGDPEEYVGQLRTLRTIYKENNVTVKKLALLTQLAVYKDIIPGYRIRPLTQLEEETQVSREVKKMREYEKALLSNYELYLKDLNVLLSSKSADEHVISEPFY